MVSFQAALADSPHAASPAASTHPVAAVALQKVRLTFGAVRALDDVSLDVEPGEILFLLGPSGSGKSSLLRVVAGIERPDSGRVLMAGEEVAGPRGFVDPERRRVGMVFQDYALFPHLTVAANVAFGIRQPAADRERTVGALLERLGLSRYAASYPHMLSGGERQRVALARALAPKPRVLLMDEPFSSLDTTLRDRVRQDTLHVLRETATTTLVVTHDPHEAMRAADRIALMRAGRVVQCGAVDDLYLRPATTFAARFLGDVNEVPGTCRHGRVETPLGAFAAPHLPEGTSARVCIRPQHLHLATAPTSLHARVVATERTGETARVVVAIAGLTSPVSLSVFGRVDLRRGDAVGLIVDPSQAVVVRDDD